MRHYDIAYVPQGTVVGYPVKPLQDMTLDEIKQKYLKTCAKSNGDVSVCSRCQSPCREGKRAIQLLANEVYDNPPIPLYGGKTMIERAKEENMLRRQKMEEEKKKSKDNRVYIEDWYEKAVESGNAVKWVMEQYGITRTKAKAKIYSWKYRHKETEKKADNNTAETPIPENTKDESFETKMEALMKQQEKYKQLMVEYQKQYEQAKQDYDLLSKKIDILCSAMDIMNE